MVPAAAPHLGAHQVTIAQGYADQEIVTSAATLVPGTASLSARPSRLSLSNRDNGARCQDPRQPRGSTVRNEGLYHDQGKWKSDARKNFLLCSSASCMAYGSSGGRGGERERARIPVCSSTGVVREAVVVVVGPITAPGSSLATLCGGLRLCAVQRSERAHWHPQRVSPIRCRYLTAPSG